jgi:hypothetical protein
VVVVRSYDNPSDDRRFSYDLNGFLRLYLSHFAFFKGKSIEKRDQAAIEDLRTKD